MHTLTTAPAYLYSLMIATTGAASHYVNVFRTTAALGTASTVLTIATVAAAGGNQWNSGAGGVYSTNGWQFSVNINATSTSATTVQFQVSAEYSV